MRTQIVINIKNYYYFLLRCERNNVNVYREIETILRFELKQKGGVIRKPEKDRLLLGI